MVFLCNIDPSGIKNHWGSNVVEGSIGGKDKIVGRGIRASGGIPHAFKHKMGYREKARNLERLVNLNYS